MASETQSVEVAVVGGGPAGLTAAIALAAAGVETALIAQSAAAGQSHHGAVSGSVAALEALEVWPLLPRRRRAADRDPPDRRYAAADPRTRSDCSRRPRSGSTAFGHNIANRHLVAALDRRAAELPPLRRIDGRGHGGRARRRPTSRSGSTTARPASAARGRRRRAQIALPRGRRHRDRPARLSAGRADAQSRAIPGRTTASPPSSTPRTARSRWCPCPACARASSAWSIRTRPSNSAALDASRAVGRDRAPRALDPRQDRGRDGRGAVSARHRDRARFAARRIALIGEAAHVIPPIGAQGLNLGLRDAATIGELVVEAQRDGADVGARRICSRATTGCAAPT